jgi:hypothetical protein
VQILALLLGNCFNDVIAILGELAPACFFTAPTLNVKICTALLLSKKMQLVRF